MKNKHLESLVEQHQRLAARSSLLKEYLLRPLRDAKQQNGATGKSLLSAYQVLPPALFAHMQKEFHKSERDLESLEDRLSKVPGLIQVDGLFTIKA
jgi:hypothetical protein